MDSSFRIVDDHVHPVLDLPSQEEPQHQALPRLISAQCWTHQRHQPLATASTLDCGITLWPGMDMAWEAQQSCSITATPQPRAGDAAPKEGPEAGGHSRWAGGEPVPRPVPSSLLQDECCQEALVPHASSPCWVTSPHLSNGKASVPPEGFSRWASTISSLQCPGAGPGALGREGPQEALNS